MGCHPSTIQVYMADFEFMLKRMYTYDFFPRQYCLWRHSAEPCAHQRDSWPAILVDFISEKTSMFKSATPQLQSP